MNETCQWLHQFFTKAWFERAKRTKLVKKGKNKRYMTWYVYPISQESIFAMDR